MRERHASVTPASPASPAGPANDDPRGRDPRRRCIVTGEIHPKADLIRFVVDPEGRVVPDVDGKLPGRGLWLYASQDVLHRAQKKHAFTRAARRKVAVSPDLPDEVERLLAARCLEYLGLAKRAGILVSGLEKVRALITAGKAQVVILAADGAENGVRRVSALASGLPLVTLLTRAELSRALGRENVVNAALMKGRLTDRFLQEVNRLAGFRAEARGDNLAAG